MVSGTLSLPSRGTFHHSLTVLSAIGHQEVFSLTRWSWQIHTKFHEFRATRAHAHCNRIHVSPTGLSPTPVLFPTRFDYTNTRHRPVMLNRTMHTPQHPHSNTSTLDTDKGLGSSGFARHYYRNHCYFLFLRVLRCFTSPRSPHAPYTFRHGSPPLTVAGFPHSDILGSTPVYRLPEAYRRFPRPSSAPDAKASTMRSHTLTTPKRVGYVYARNVSNTLVFDDKKNHIT
jgi:hypothetical protein